MLVALGLVRTAPVARTAAAAVSSGESIYKDRCATCHGLAGELGTKNTPSAVGDRSVLELAHLISKSMPEDDPGTCTGDEAQKVAAYIYDAFVSADGQAAFGRRGSNCRG